MKPTIDPFFILRFGAKLSKLSRLSEIQHVLGNIFRQAISPRRRLSLPPCGAVAPCSAALCLDVHLAWLCELACERRRRGTAQLHGLHVNGMCVATKLRSDSLGRLRFKNELRQRLRRAASGPLGQQAFKGTGMADIYVQYSASALHLGMMAFRNGPSTLHMGADCTTAGCDPGLLCTYDTTKNAPACTNCPISCGTHMQHSPDNWGI